MKNPDTPHPLQIIDEQLMEAHNQIIHYDFSQPRRRRISPRDLLILALMDDLVWWNHQAEREMDQATTALRNRPKAVKHESPKGNEPKANGVPLGGSTRRQKSKQPEEQ